MFSFACVVSILNISSSLAEEKKQKNKHTYHFGAPRFFFASALRFGPRLRLGLAPKPRLGRRAARRRTRCPSARRWWRCASPGAGRWSCCAGCRRRGHRGDTWGSGRGVRSRGGARGRGKPREGAEFFRFSFSGLARMAGIAGQIQRGKITPGRT